MFQPHETVTHTRIADFSLRGNEFFFTVRLTVEGEIVELRAGRMLDE